MSETAANSPDNSASTKPSGAPIGWTRSVFFRTHAPRLEALIRSRLSRRFQARFDAEDIVQSAFRSFFLRPFPAPVAADPEGDLWPLLAEIAVRKLSQQIRRHSAQRRNVASDVANGEEIVSAAASPDDSASLAEVIGLAQDGLDEGARQAFNLRLEGFEILEIAERLGISERTVRRQLAAAKKILQRLLDLEPAPLIAKALNDSAVVLPIDLRFDDYRLHQWIGDGAVGNVYRATEKSSGRTVAVKFLKKAFRAHPQAVASFRREVEIVAQLKHPGIIQIAGMGQTPNQGGFLVMDWAPGGDLAQHTAADRPSLSDIRRWALELTEALDHAHQHGVIHCDLKPSNVLLGAAGRLQISDFGLARQQVGWSDPGLSQGGTPAFIAPELIEPSFGPIGPWTDVFGIGAVVFNLLTGRSLYEGTTLDALLANIVSDDPIRWPQSLQNTIPTEWRMVCDALLAKSVATRCPDMVAVRQAIQKLAPVEGF